MPARNLTVFEVDPTAVLKRSRSLPHWEMPGGIYFVSFRLDDSVPDEVVRSYRAEKKKLEERTLTASPLEQIELSREMVRLYCRRIDQCLDVGLGECRLGNSAIATMVSSSFQFFDRERYDLFAWTIMPNHVHMLFRPLEGHTLSDIMHSLKSYTAKKANAIDGKRGAFWEREYFDHLVRSQKDLRRFCRYICDNPRKAKLADWPWVWTCEELGAVLE